MLKITHHPGGIFTLFSKQKVSTDIDTAWNFFSQPSNLNLITPKDLNFKINSGFSDSFYQGKIISYSIRLFFLFKLNWTTEITKVEDKVCFIDKQLFGPYKLWHHEHYFEDNNDGTVTIIDKVKYKLYFHPISLLIHKIVIKNKLLHIFNVRAEKINKIFS